MKILYLPGKYPFCYYYRGLLPAVYSGQMSVKEFIVNGEEIPPDKIIEQAKKADIVVLQRPQDKKRLELVIALKKLGKKVIFENDDTYLVGKGILLERLENDKQREIAIELSETTNQILRLCDGAIASTEVLADEYRQINPNVAVLKNCIDPLDAFPCKKNDTGKFRIGFIGSVTTNDDYIHIKKQIKKLDERGDITIVVLGVKYKNGEVISFMKEDAEFWGSLKNVEWHPYVPVTSYMAKVASLALDLAIIPRKDNYFNRCKSNLKYLEMSLLKIPVLAQSFPLSPYNNCLCTLVTNNSMWYSKIIEIKENYAHYKDLALQAHKDVLENYNIRNYHNVWTETITKL